MALLKLSLAVLLLAVTVRGQELRVTASNTLNFLFIDDFQHTPLPNATNWMLPDRVPLDEYARLIAIRGNNIQGGCSGIMVGSYDSPHDIVSDRSWKCSDSPANGWQFLGFDDSSWEPAYEIALNGEIVTGCGLFIIQDMPANAYWIWTDGFLDRDQIVSCRGYTNVCARMPCENGGTCNQNQGTLCSCPVRWGGTFCEISIDECDSSPCQNNGECELDDSGYNCKCPIGFTGVNCETDTTDCASQPCQHGGTCNFEVEGGYTCSCMPGYSGLDCEIDIDECASAPCLNGAECHDGVNEIHCECVPGYEGFFCQNDINECLSNPCQSAATCEDQVNGYQCQCHTGYTGVHCETPIGGCESDPCQNGGTCTLGGPGGAIQCICTPGWSGPLCNSNENECLSNPCQNDGTCVDGDGEYECFCRDEFNGPNCEFVIPNCGSIMAVSGFPATNRFEILCEINIIDHSNDLTTPCRQLLQGLNYFNDADGLVAAGGTFGCYATRFPAEVNNACVPGYNQQGTLGACVSCTHMGVCIDYPNSRKSSPKK